MLIYFVSAIKENYQCQISTILITLHKRSVWLEVHFSYYQISDGYYAHDTVRANSLLDGSNWKTIVSFIVSAIFLAKFHTVQFNLSTLDPV